MGSSGYSETEKIKILYEESLGDINKLTKKLEDVSLKLNTSATTVHEIEKLSASAISKASETFKELANNEMKLAGDSAIAALSGEVGKIAQKIAGDAADSERYYARNKAVGFVGAVVLLTALIFGGTGYLYATSMTASHLNAAERDLAQANLLLGNANKQVDEKTAILKKNYLAEIEGIRDASGWAGSPTGQLAKKFFDLGDGASAATCKSDTWEIIDIKKDKWCVPKRRDLIGGNTEKFGWKIP